MPFAHGLLIRAVVHLRTGLFIGLLLCAMSVAHATAPTTLTVNTLSDVYGGDCSGTCSLRDAMTNIASGGTIDFAQALPPGTIVLGSLLHPAVSMTIQGPGSAQLAISANEGGRVLVVDSEGTIVNIVGVTLRDGYVYGTDGGNGDAGTGAGGEAGGDAAGGCISVTSASLVLDQVDVRNCGAQGGFGGNGGTGTAGSGLSAGGVGGDGGDGGEGHGGSISVDGFGNLTLRNSSLTDAQAYGGLAGVGGNGGSGVFHGAGGKGGSGGSALGGAIFFNGENLSIYNTTIAEGWVIPAGGSRGGNGDSAAAASPGGAGGNGGTAYAGLLYVAGSGFARLEFATLADALAVPGSGGKGGTGNVSGASGQSGGVAAAALLNSSSNTSVISTVIGGPGTPLCNLFSPISAFGANFDEDSSCGFTLHGSFAQLFRAVNLVDAPNNHLAAYMPLYHSAVIDAATTCNDLTAQAVTADEFGTPRPQGSACDLGAIEADYIFVGGFE